MVWVLGPSGLQAGLCCFRRSHEEVDLSHATFQASPLDVCFILMPLFG